MAKKPMPETPAVVRDAFQLLPCQPSSTTMANSSKVAAAAVATAKKRRSSTEAINTGSASKAVVLTLSPNCSWLNSAKNSKSTTTADKVCCPWLNKGSQRLGTVVLCLMLR